MNFHRHLLLFSLMMEILLSSGFFDGGTILDVFPPFIPLGQRVQFLVLIQVGILVVFCEIHVAVGVDVIDE